MEKSNVPKAQISKRFTHKNSGWFDVNLTCSRSRKTLDDPLRDRHSASSQSDLAPAFGHDLRMYVDLGAAIGPDPAAGAAHYFRVSTADAHRDGLDQNRA